MSEFYCINESSLKWDEKDVKFEIAYQLKRIADILEEKEK